MFDVCNVDALPEHGLETVDDDTLVVNPSPGIVCKAIEKNQARLNQLHAVTEAIAFRMRGKHASNHSAPMWPADARDGAVTGVSQTGTTVAGFLQSGLGRWRA